MLRSIYLFILTYIYTIYLQLKEHFSEKSDEQKIDHTVFERYREYLANKNTIRELWTSILYTLDVVLDWIFVVELYGQEEKINQDLCIPSLIFAILGTILYLLDAFDVFQWLNLCSSGDAWRVTFGNFMLEDLPQMVITSITAGRKSLNEDGNIFTKTIIVNLMISSFALITKCVAIQESWENQDEEFTFPTLHSFVKKNQKLAEILVKEDIEIFPCQLERLMNDFNKERECPTLEILVKTDMPGGVIALVQSFENIKKACIEKKKPAEIAVRFKNKSKMSTLEVSHLVVKMIELEDVTWKLDLRECLIGTCTVKQVKSFLLAFLPTLTSYLLDVVNNDNNGTFTNIFFFPDRKLDDGTKILYEGNTIFGLQLLLRQIGLLLLKTKQPIVLIYDDAGKYISLQHKIQVFRENATDVRLENIVLDEFVIKGLCHVLKFATDITTLIIINDYNNGTTQEEAGNQFGIIKEEILRFETKHITSFDYSYDNNRKVQWAYAEDGKLTELQREELENDGSGRDNFLISKILRAHEKY